MREFETHALRIVKNNAGAVVSVQRKYMVQDGIIHIGEELPVPGTDYAEMNKDKKFVTVRDRNPESGAMDLVHVPVKEEWRELEVFLDDGILRGPVKDVEIIIPGIFNRN